MLETELSHDIAAIDELSAGPSHRSLGTAAVRGTVELLLPGYTDLPEGFEFAAADTIDPTELAALMQTVEIGSDMTAQDIIEVHRDFQRDNIRSVEIGVRNMGDNELVGYGGLVIDTNGDGVMGNFVVNPAFQGRGIGRAIVDQRLVQADILGVSRIFIPGLESTNTLRSYYAQRGFVEQQGGTLVRSVAGSTSLAAK